MEMESYESLAELKDPQDYIDGGNNIPDDINEKKLNDPRVQAMIERSGHNSSSSFVVSLDYYDHPKEAIGANSNIYKLFKPSNFRDVQNPVSKHNKHGHDI